jgi:hypothetical protein
MRSLYFDIDGTLLDINSGKPKTALANGAFEKLVRRSGLDRLVCTGQFIDVIRDAAEFGGSYDGMGALFRVCRGVFLDETWFRDNVLLVQDPTNRAGEVDFTEDWWYVDDMAEYYFGLVRLNSTFAKHVGRRILVPSSDGDGEDITNWFEEINKNDTT